MKKNNIKLIHWILVILSGIVLLASSCKDEYRNEWFGKWQMRNMNTGNHQEPVDTIFFNFQTDLFMYQILSPAADTTYNFYGVNEIKGDSLYLQLEAVPVKSSPFWKVSGWEGKDHTYAIKHITSKELILSDQMGTYNFRKF